MEEFKKADRENPFMGLGNQICTEPKYWCKLHQVWLSEKDTERKGCKHKLTYDMIGYKNCIHFKQVNISDYV